MTPKLMASSFDRRATFFVRLRQMMFSVRSVSYSSTLRGNSLTKALTIPSNSGGISFARPPTLMKLGVSRAPVTCSTMSRMVSRSRNA